MAVAEIKF